jgi:hypothetical protein
MSYFLIGASLAFPDSLSFQKEVKGAFFELEAKRRRFAA